MSWWVQAPDALAHIAHLANVPLTHLCMSTQAAPTLPVTQVLCSTSTLAVGVNLPAYLVIIKGTRRYAAGDGEGGSSYTEYERSICLQMCGRAGRPQFDSDGVAVIMTQKPVRMRVGAVHAEAVTFKRLCMHGWMQQYRCHLDAPSCLTGNKLF